jgi:hypothetical protein
MVIQGTLNAAQIQAEMECLVPGKGKWMVEEITPNTFKTAFPSKNELQRMTDGVLCNQRIVRRLCLLRRRLVGAFSNKP